MIVSIHWKRFRGFTPVIKSIMLIFKYKKYYNLSSSGNATHTPTGVFQH